MKHTNFALVAMLGSLWIPATFASQLTPQALVEADLLLQSAALQPQSKELATHTMMLLADGLRISAGQALLEAKHDRLAGWAAHLSFMSGEERTLLAPHPRAIELESTHSSCHQPYPLDAANALTTQLNSDGELWLQLPLVNVQRGYSTRGSSIDAELSWVAKCGDTPTVVDDAIGLQALIAVPESVGGLLRVRNRGGNGRLLLSTTAVGSISGRVTERQSGNGASGIGLQAYSTELAPLGSTTSNANGTYTLTLDLGSAAAQSVLLRTVTSNVALGDQGYQNIFCDDISVNSNSIFFCNHPAMTPINVTAAGTVNGIDFSLPRVSRLSVRVIDEAQGTAISGARVDLYNRAQQGRARITDSAGRVFFDGLHLDAEYVPLTSANGYASELHDGLPCRSIQCQNFINATWVSVAGGTIPELQVSLRPSTPPQGPKISFEAAAPMSGSVAANLFLHDAAGQTVWTGFGSEFQDFYDLLPGNYRIVARNIGFGVSQVYPGIQCATFDCQAELSQGTPVSFPLTTDITMQLTLFAKFSGTVTRSTGEPVIGAQVVVRDLAGVQVASVNTGNTGAYMTSKLPPGDYRIYTDVSGFVDEVYPNLPCDTPLLIANCNSAPPVTLSFADFVADFSLDRAGSISGISTCRGSTASNAVVGPSGEVVSFSLSDRLSDIPPGSYRVGATSANCYPRLVGGQDCAVATPTFAACTSGTNVTVSSGAQTSVSLELNRRGLRVRVTNTQSGAPLAGIVVDQWTGQTLPTSLVTDANGIAQFLPVSVPFRISTDNSLGFVNEVFDNLQCPNGSAFAGLCNISNGSPQDPVQWQDIPNGPQMEITLAPVGLADPIFVSSFE